MPSPSSRPVKIAIYLLLAFSMVLLGMHYAHLRADFPNHSPWVDWAKYTDEGWYGDAAIRYHLSGRWNRPGDFNPAAALPVWPLLEGLLFGLTGVDIVPARALSVSVFLCSVFVAYLLMRRCARPAAEYAKVPDIAEELAPAIAVLVLSANPFLYTFSRMAIVEPLLVLLTLIAMLVAWTPLQGKGEIARQVVLGILMAWMIGTKTTAVCLLPAVLWMVGAGAQWQWRKALRVAFVACSTMAAVMGIYLFGVVHTGHWADFRYLFTANQYTGITRETFWHVVSETLKDTAWTGPSLWFIAITTIFLATLFRRSIWRDPLFTGCVLWVSGYFTFLAYHASLQPRYYMVIATPLTILAMRGLEDLCVEWPALTIPSAIVLTAVTIAHCMTLEQYVRYPQYTFADAAAKVKKLVEAEKNHSKMVLSISGSDLTLMTGLPSICDDFGTMELEQRVARYRPGWFIAWNYVEDDKMEALHHLYRLTRVAEFPAMDDPDRNLLIVYRLDAR